MTVTIDIRPAVGTWVVRTGGAVIAESKKALELIEGDYPPVIYFPVEDIAMAFLDASDTTSRCPHKGDAVYYSISAPGEDIADAAWVYNDPLDGVAAIKGHVAFYPSKVTVEKL